MIGKLKGIVDSINEQHMVLDVQGVGYEVLCSQTTLRSLPAKGEATTLSIITHVREDHIHLYGFSAREEKQAFELLIKVNGVGTRMALAILSALTPSQMAVAIAAQDKKAFTVANGVGPKLATRLITELKDKFTMDAVSDVDQFAQSGSTTTDGSSLEPNAVNDAIAALVSLGYGRSDAYQIIHRISAHNDNMAVDDLIREALKQLSS